MPNQTLSLSQTQQLQMILAPQLRQSLEMLQLPVLELRAMIQKELEQNPTVEEALGDAPQEETGSSTAEEPVADADSAPAQPAPEPVSQVELKPELNFDQEFAALRQLDEEWRDYFFQEHQSSSYSKEDADRRQFFMDSIPQVESLQEHLLNQLNLSDLSDDDKQIGELLIGSINDDGYLTSTMDEIAAAANADRQHIEDILAVIQDFHPSGVGARDLKECLMLQLDRLDKSDSLAAAIVKDHLTALGDEKYGEIAQTLGVDALRVQQAARIIAILNPKPGSIFSANETAYVVPEVVVQKIDGEYVIMMNDDNLPRIRISSYYRDLLSDETTKPEVKSYIRERIRSGAFLIKSIHQRQTTINRIASEIVETQKEFLDNGISHLKPLTMSQIAVKVGVHETTVSRAVAGKYMKTPNGLYEMKYFFTPGIKTTSGVEVSNKAVRDMIAGMVAAEDVSKPLSDQEIVANLKSQGIEIARRTIAKYRLLLKIPPSHMRKI